MTDGYWWYRRRPEYCAAEPVDEVVLVKGDNVFSINEVGPLSKNQALTYGKFIRPVDEIA